MNIESKGPTALVFDVSFLTDTLDRVGEIAPLAWQYVIERELVEKAGLTLVTSVPKCQSLQPQYRLIESLQRRYELNFVDGLDERILSFLREHVVSIEMTREILVIIRRKHLTL